MGHEIWIMRHDKLRHDVMSMKLQLLHPYPASDRPIEIHRLPSPFHHEYTTHKEEESVGDCVYDGAPCGSSKVSSDMRLAHRSRTLSRMWSPVAHLHQSRVSLACSHQKCQKLRQCMQAQASALVHLPMHDRPQTESHTSNQHARGHVISPFSTS